MDATAQPFLPRFELWSDGATKRRWMRLPPGTQIDTKDPDSWQFPNGTRFWKEFTRDGVRVETRFLQKVRDAPEDWVAGGYLWNDDQSDATLSTAGAVDALGTGHDVPAAGRC